MNLQYLKEAARFFKNRFGSYKEYSGDVSQMCRSIVAECWNGRYFQVSNGNFSEFYVRDFAFCVESLLALGYKKEVDSTLNFALETFSRHGRITTTITRDGVPIDVFGIGPDSIALLVRSLRISKNSGFVERHERFLNSEINRYFGEVFDEKTGLVRQNKYFSSSKDHCIRNSSCYDNCMLASLSDDLKRLKLDNPFGRFELKKTIEENFWTGSHFKDDLTSKHIASDANTYPYWLGVFDSKEMIKSSVAAIQDEGLDKPFPIKYTKSRKGNFLFPYRLFVPNYEGNSIWAHNAMNFIKVVRMVDKDKARFYVEQYKRLVERQRNFLEVYNPDGTPYKTPFYKADSGLLWAANLLTLMNGV